jgi:hypothetical protein
MLKSKKEEKKDPLNFVQNFDPSVDLSMKFKRPTKALLRQNFPIGESSIKSIVKLGQFLRLGQGRLCRYKLSYGIILKNI